MDSSQANTLATRGANDPVWWVENILGDSPWQTQKDILEALVHNREVNVRSCHSAGKSWVASRAALWFLFNHPDSLVITTAPTARQVRGILWKEIRTAHSHSLFPLGGEPSTTALRISPSWMAIGFTAAEHDPDRLQLTRSCQAITAGSCASATLPMQQLRSEQPSGSSEASGSLSALSILQTSPEQALRSLQCSRVSGQH